ncbi:MAG TPA: DUF58 domain-containing protein [Mycobacteriales bacterium]|nr:DUF58 domain-containing protein [Mycobacteriales bacterium]
MTELAEPITDIVDVGDVVVARPMSAARRSGKADWFPGLQRLVGLTNVGLGMFVAIVVVIVVGRLMTSHAMTMLGYALALVLVVCWLLGRRNLPVQATRSELPSRVPAGRTVEAEITLTSRRRVSTIVIEESLDRHLGQPVRIALAVLPSGRDSVHDYSFTPTLRGIYPVGPLIAEFSDPFGFTRRRQQIAEPAKIIVHPAIEPVVDRITSREWEDPPVRPPVSRAWPTGFEFYGMRDYAPGDDPRQIVWRAVAQYDKFLVRVAEQGITDRVNIYFNSNSADHSSGDPSATFESAVSVVASLGVKHLADGFSVSINRNDSLLLRNYRGAGKRVPMLDALAAVKRERVPFEQALDRLLVEPSRTTHNIVVTPKLTSEMARRLRLLVQRGVAVLLVVIVTDDTDPMTLHRAAGLGCTVVEVAPGAALGSVFSAVSSGGRR